ncbi:hypothetical protein BG28_05925 [Nesterenkonia sp. AN1]|uniref:Uncharacterized protein n=1 Tax=Nesterenkonia aurantiaca TaxID=1436010 RepID=A0A4R7G4M6_9MICC|nr:hypothetical protein [Nesterenkonia]EXF24529.1 hypothetical protein BG28_05925 [Nesterenkonia sp. AN1]TDS86176.1 hypothetical protein EV640_104202 [Nesterenkonia aurantiaca]
MVRSHSTAAIERTTRRAWAQWVTALDDAGAAALPHREIAGIVYDHMPEDVENRGWWAQSVAVAYEQHHALRRPGESRAGEFQASVSKTYPGDMDAALQAWIGLVHGRDSFGGVTVQGEPGTSATERWRYWRAGLVDGSRVAVTISQKSLTKSSVGVGHTKLGSPEEVERWKAVWRELLAQL